MERKELIYTVLFGAIIFLLLLSFLIIIWFRYFKKNQKYMSDMSAKELSFQQTLLQTQLEIQEQTFKNISQEIHDNIGQALSLAKLNLNTMPLLTDEKAVQKISTSKELVSKAIIDLRDLSRSLNTDYIADMGLLKAIEYELELIQKSAGIHTRFNLQGAPFTLDKQKELILFRIMQEIFNNIVKHAGAENIFLSIQYDVSKLTLTIKDDGKGVNLEPLSQTENKTIGLGIRNMHSRAGLIGADFKMSSVLGQGTEVNINLPISTNG